MKIQTKNMIIGILYLSLVLFGPFTLLILPQMFSDQSNISDFISSNTHLLTLWILGDVIIILIEVFLTTYLYQVTKIVDAKNALTAFILRMMMIFIMVFNVTILMRLFSSTLDNQQINDLLSTHQMVLYLWQITFFGHLLFLGLTVLKAHYIPKIIAYGLLIGSFAYLLDSTGYFLNINHALFTLFTGIFLGVIAVSEISFAILLLIRRKHLFHA